MEFRVLGPVGIFSDGAYVHLGGTKARTILAALLLRPGKVVSTDHLIDAVWGEQPPPTAPALIQTQIAALRKVLAAVGGDAGPCIVTVSPGYLLQRAEAPLDLVTFEESAGRARRAQRAGDVEQAAIEFGTALGAWTGPALGGAASPLASAEAFALEQQRARVRKEWIEVELACGRHSALLPDLYTIVGESPVDEVLRGLLMVALYRSGRVSEALAVCRDGRRLRAEELGMDPGPAMRELERAILNCDPSLELQPAVLAPAPSAGPTSNPDTEPNKEPSTEPDAPHRSRRRLWILAPLAGLAGLGVLAGAWWLVAGPTTANPRFTVAAEPFHAPTTTCLLKTTANSDERNGAFLQKWDKAALCQNVDRAPLYLAPSTAAASPVVSRLRTGAVNDPSWFLCWTVGAPDVTGNKIYYYTSGDEQAPGREYRFGWGFVPAPYLSIGADHTRSGLPECPPVPD
ncbi:DNA-binding SARP family transcriptional activator [Catenulispora sp. MAP5-51]|uniref:AfsR/SARP family transcriptional regulator n=1 Tax=Catenulispora sp. MAP5-51 TaxID=3156298 RepID=UPI0035154EFE